MASIHPAIMNSPLKDALDFSRVQRVLVTKFKHLGDVLLTSPVFQVLKNHHPHLEIDALVYQDCYDMLSGHPDIRQVYIVDRRKKQQGPFYALQKEGQLLRQLRQQRYDLLLHLTESFRGVWLAHMLNIPHCVSGDYPRRQTWLWRKTFAHRYAGVTTAKRHTVEKHLDALRRLGVYPHADERSLVLDVDIVAQSSVAALLQQHGVSPKSFIHFHPGSRWLFKCWPITQAAALIDRLQERAQTVVLTGAPSSDEHRLNQAIVEKVKHGADKIVDLSGQLNLKQLAAISSHAKAFIGVDSAPMHIASAMRTPVVALFGPSGDHEWHPWGTEYRVLRSSKHPCQPCGLDGCGGGKVSDCLTAIRTEDVMSALAQLGVLH